MWYNQAAPEVLHKIRDIVFVGPTQDDVRAFPDAARKLVGFALFRAQEGAMHPNVKPLKGFGGAGVLEVVADSDGDTYRAVYTVRLRTAVYVLHAFQKKSAHGIRTAQHDMDLVRRRLAWAQRIETVRLTEPQDSEQDERGERQ
jgi:phage-related protein